MIITDICSTLNCYNKHMSRLLDCLVSFDNRSQYALVKMNSRRMILKVTQSNVESRCIFPEVKLASPVQTAHQEPKKYLEHYGLNSALVNRIKVENLCQRLQKVRKTCIVYFCLNFSFNVSIVVQSAYINLRWEEIFMSIFGNVDIQI